MVQDARFEDGDEKPLRLMAADRDDLAVISALVQDAVFPAAQMRWLARERRFVLLLNRFRWEDPLNARGARKPERVQSLLVIEDVLKVQSQGVAPSDDDMVLSLLTIEFEPGEDGSGALVLTLAGDGAVRLEVESINLLLKDVTRPYLAPSHKVPSHPF